MLKIMIRIINNDRIIAVNYIITIMSAIAVIIELK